MLFVLAVPHAFAKPGGAASVDSDADCDDAQRQDSTICSPAFVWINVSGAPIGEGCLLDCILACNDGSTPLCDIADTATTSCDSSNEKQIQWESYAFSYDPPTEPDAVCSITVISTGCTDEKQNGTVAGDGFKNECLL
jgi:hypothetical protein